MRSKIIIVDKKDKIINFKERENIKNSDIYRVSGLWITNNDGDVLLARRSFTKSHDPGKWGPAVAGTVEEGETYKSNIIKEAKEELGLNGIVPKKGLKERVVGKHNFFCQWYLIIVNKDLRKFKIKKDEVVEIRWFTKEALLKKIDSHPHEFIKSMKQWINLLIKT